MSIITKASAKTYFVTGAYPTQGQFADTIDSYLGLGETSLQTVSGNVNFFAGIQVSGNQVGTAAYANTGTVIINSGGALTIGATQVTTAMLATTAVSAGTYASPTITIDVAGRITSAAGSSNAPVLTVKRQVFAATGTYTPSAGMLYCDIEAWGAGGGGGGIAANNGNAAAGGGAGGYVKKVVAAATIGASKAVTIGAAGTAGSTAGGTGGTGGTTSVGSTIVQATGGVGGTGTTASTTIATGGAGGVGSSGDINATGAVGVNGNGSQFNGGNGGVTSLGGNGLGGAINTSATSSAAGNAAVANSGSGGGGACSSGGSVAAQLGGAGGSGYVVITEYCSQ